MALLNAWCPENGQVKVYLTDTGEEAVLLQEWLRLRMIRSQVPRVVDAGKLSVNCAYTGYSRGLTGKPVHINVSALLGIVAQCCGKKIFVQ